MFTPQDEAELFTNPGFGIERVAVNGEEAEQARTFFGFVGEDLQQVGVGFVHLGENTARGDVDFIVILISSTKSCSMYSENSKKLPSEKVKRARR
jgi:hypothetical protein